MKLSERAEELTAEFLRAQGWNIVARNFRRVATELDIVATKRQTLIVVEVKWRKKPIVKAEDLALLLARKKVFSLKRGCAMFLALRQINPVTIRFDLALVSPSPTGQIHLDYRVGVF